MSQDLENKNKTHRICHRLGHCSVVQNLHWKKELMNIQFGDQSKEVYVWESSLHNAWKEMEWWPAGDQPWILTNYTQKKFSRSEDLSGRIIPTRDLLKFSAKGHSCSQHSAGCAVTQRHGAWYLSRIMLLKAAYQSCDLSFFQPNLHLSDHNKKSVLSFTEVTKDQRFSLGQTQEVW